MNSNMQMNGEEFLLQAILDAVSDPVFLVNEKGIITFANQAARHILDSGLPAAIRADIIAAANDQRGRQPEGNKEIRCNGETYAVNFTKITNIGGFLGTVVVLKNITAIRVTEAELKRVEDNYRELEVAMKSSYDGIFVTDGRGVAINYNEAYNRITGIDASELIGMSVDEIVRKGYGSESVVLKVLKTRDTATTMTTFKSGKKTLMTANPVFNANGEIVRVVTNVRDITELLALNSQLEQAKELTERYYSEILHLRSQQAAVKGLIVESETMKTIVANALQVAFTNATVLISGDSGVGKEVLARTIHNHSEFKQGPFVKINCSAIPENLLESELFGYEKGAFTSASKTGKSGLFEIATGGTVFLDEIGEIPLSLQAKLLGVLQDLQFSRVGGIKTIKMNSRIIAATNRNLEDMVARGSFRKDLYYRLNVVSLKIPPLAERKDDIFPLAQYFLELFNNKYKVYNTLSPQVLNAFVKYDWPGNVREMANLLERLVVLSPNQQITLNLLPDAMRGKAAPQYISAGITLNETIHGVERNLIQNLLAKGCSTYQIAKELGISQSTVVRKIRKLKINNSRSSQKCINDAFLT